MTKTNSQSSKEFQSNRIINSMNTALVRSTDFSTKYFEIFYNIEIFQYLDQVFSSQLLCTEKKRIFKFVCF